MRQPVHFENVSPLGCGLLQDEQQMEREGEDDIVLGAGVGDLPSISSDSSL